METAHKDNVLSAVLVILFCGLTLAFCTYLSSVPVGEPSNKAPTTSSQQDDEEDDGIKPINRELGLGTNEIDDFLGL